MKALDEIIKKLEYYENGSPFPASSEQHNELLLAVALILKDINDRVRR